MATPDALQKPPAKRRLPQPTVRSHVAYMLLSGLAIMVMLSLLRLALLAYNREMILTTPASTFIEAFGNGLRFDLRLTVYIMIPLLIGMAFQPLMAMRGLWRFWLTITSSIALFLGLMDMDFYREFHQRLNGLVFQYVKEDPKTVMSMIWYGYPVVRYLLAWALVTWLLSLVFKGVDRLTRPHAPRAPTQWYKRLGVFVVCLLVVVLAARGTLRQGPPLRWGDAYTTESNFANQLGLNSTLSLIEAAKSEFSSQRSNIWKSTMPAEQAREVVRKMLLTPNDTLVDADIAPVRRDNTPPQENTLPIKNVVVILMESFAGHSVGALGADTNITPNFDKLAKEGVLFDHFFSNGTHTHQGMFATMGCFPNLPGFEYLMQTPEGSHKLSGLPAQLRPRKFDDVYVYNGDFAWDNQSGFFGNQGMTTFIGRNDFVNPVFSDPTWGVSDQDMFNRGNEELAARGEKGQPFYALLQSLSNHVPYALPKQLPVEPVTGQGSLDLHLTAMRYADWSLGQFFEKARKSPYFNQTLFVIVGDHGFANNNQVTEMDLGRFNVPLLLIGPGIQQKFGAVNHTVGTQIDIVPTIMGRLGGTSRNQCWGRDLLNLPPNDPGFGMIKPSGGELEVALVTGNRIFIEPAEKDMPAKLYQYQLGRQFSAKLIPDNDPDAADKADLRQRLDAFIQTATQALLDDRAGAEAAKKEAH
jgi:phosphoglycerol transferase MdoB-like AlkP superfamily enzyme